MANFQLRVGDLVKVLVQRDTPRRNDDGSYSTTEFVTETHELVTSRCPEEKLITTATLDYEWQMAESNSPNAPDQQQIVIRLNVK